jgi:NADPH:quinone reductase-like Zn-dependent oxidoreductase
MPAAWQIVPAEPKDWRTTDGIENLHLATDVEKPSPGPRSALVRIRAAALNARDMMVVARDPIYQSLASPNLTPCADGAGIIEEVGEGSIWRPGQRVVLCVCEWLQGDPGTLLETKGLGAADVEGTLREYAIVVWSTTFPHA